jgi:formylglycine-generating enzyme required for sulfatase activity
MATYEKKTIEEHESLDAFARTCDGCYRIYESDNNYHVIRTPDEEDGIFSSQYILNPHLVWERGRGRVNSVHQPKAETNILAIEPQMVCIPAGKFLMGSKDNDESASDCEKPQHEVELSEYFIGKYPVTNREYQAFVRDIKFSPPKSFDNDQYPAEKGDHPVVTVSWQDAQEYCKWLSQKTDKQYRLPSEAEWEKAARGTDGRVYPWGDDIDPKKYNVSPGHTTPVGQFSQAGGDSPYGCADMTGNVLEWCNDWFDEHEYEKRSSEIVKDPAGPETGNGMKVIRGGSWSMKYVRPRVSYRGGQYTSGWSWNKGFRLLLRLPS